MISIKVDKNGIDFSKVKVGYRMDLSGTYEGEHIIMEKAIVKKVDIENNEITVEPFINRNSCMGFSKEMEFGMRLIDKDGNVLIDSIK